MSSNIGLTLSHGLKSEACFWKLMLKIYSCAKSGKLRKSCERLLTQLSKMQQRVKFFFTTIQLCCTFHPPVHFFGKKFRKSRFSLVNKILYLGSLRHSMVFFVTYVNLWWVICFFKILFYEIQPVYGKFLRVRMGEDFNFKISASKSFIALSSWSGISFL